MGRIFMYVLIYSTLYCLKDADTLKWHLCAVIFFFYCTESLQGFRIRLIPQKFFCFVFFAFSRCFQLLISTEIGELVYKYRLRQMKNINVLSHPSFCYVYLNRWSDLLKHVTTKYILHSSNWLGMQYLILLPLIFNTAWILMSKVSCHFFR